MQNTSIHPVARLARFLILFFISLALFLYLFGLVGIGQPLFKWGIESVKAFVNGVAFYPIWNFWKVQIHHLAVPSDVELAGSVLAAATVAAWMDHWWKKFYTGAANQ